LLLSCNGGYFRPCLQFHPLFVDVTDNTEGHIYQPSELNGCLSSPLMSLWTHDTWSFVEVLLGGEFIIADDITALAVLSCFSGAHRTFDPRIPLQLQLSRTDLHLNPDFRLSIPPPNVLSATNEVIRECKHPAMRSVRPQLRPFVPCAVHQAIGGGWGKGSHIRRHVRSTNSESAMQY
jgi:hypothetical protein